MSKLRSFPAFNLTRPGSSFSRPATLALITVVCSAAGFARADEPSAQLRKALSYAPNQPDVVYEQVSEEQMGECSIEERIRSGVKGFWITGAGGQPLRWFADTNRDNKLDRWSYYNAGVEVYRESDSDFNGTADQYRWLSTEGLRKGADADEDGEIDRWDMISAEEVTAEVVRATAGRDANQFARLLLRDDEIEGLGLGDEKADLLRQRISDAQSQFRSWSAGQGTVTARSKWTNFGADKPGVVPAGTDESKKDIVVYENVVALFEDGGEPKQLLVGTLIKVGECWRIVDLPRAVSEGAVVSDSGVFFSASFTPRGAPNAVPTGGISKAMERLVTELQDIDGKLESATGDPEVLQARRADVLEKLVSAAESDSDRGTWIRQFADTVGAAAQTGEYPGGVRRLQDFTKKLATVNATDDEVSYVVYRTLSADHNQRMLEPDAKYETLQKSYLANLQSFVRKYPESDDAADAMIQIALSAEFSGESKTAESWYQKAQAGFGTTLPGRKAAGALRRLQLDGKRFGLEGNTIDNRKFNSTSYLGGPVIYHCWASWCDGCKAEMRALKELQNKYAKSKLRIVGINFDNSVDQGTQFLKENNYPWVHLYDAGGLDSTLAVSYGILTLPVNFVVDSDGRVVKTGVHWTELDGVIEELVK